MNTSNLSGTVSGDSTTTSNNNDELKMREIPDDDDSLNNNRNNGSNNVNTNQSTDFNAVMTIIPDQSSIRSRFLQTHFVCLICILCIFYLYI